jgi:hypothetical protein
MAAAYELKLRPAYEATTMFIGLEMTSGATPAARKTAKANGTRSCGCAGYRLLTKAKTSGVSRSTAASLLRRDAVARLRRNTRRKA